MNRAALLFSACLLISCTGTESNAIQDWIDEQTSDSEFIAIAAAYLKDGEVTHFAGGRVAPGSDIRPDADIQFEIGSLTKSFTDLLLAEMVEKEFVTFDTTIGDLLGDDVTLNNAAVSDITLLQLATHTSGLARMPANFAPTDPLDPYREYDENALLMGLTMARDKQPLGNQYTYSNLGVGTLGYLLGRAYGDGYIAAMNELVIAPLGLTRTSFDPADGSATPYRGGAAVKNWSLDALAGAGALRSTTNDLIRFAKIMLGEIENPLEHDLEANKEILAPASGFKVTRVWHVASSGDGEVYWHNGGTGGFWSFFGFRPATDEALVMLVSGDPDPTRFGMEVMAIDPPEPDMTEIDEAIFGQYALNETLGIGIYDIEGTLVGQVSGQPPAGLHSVGEDWYAIDIADASVRFLREDDQVVALELVQNGIVQTASRSADVAEAVSKTELTLSHEVLEGYVGEYAINADAKFTIRLGEEQLEAALTGQGFFPVFAKGDDVFFYKVVDAELHFVRDDQGTVNALVLHQGGIVQRAERTE